MVWLRVFDIELNPENFQQFSPAKTVAESEKNMILGRIRQYYLEVLMNIRRDFKIISWQMTVSFSSWCNPETFYVPSYSKKNSF